ncbi:uncharacterized protein CYBJADRAFT_60647 [Cyberlindnera jadinii NRRL Y-1542]|uniref:Uncharacterized protein n=1 Tax=Cyberlindnera jadinii (strain ATCC 18201 / CBS 1600 / BCRC 20928 / JCM 3617 / NBRC 0987 / NRRL Y-1542) TaxID=983966 RepID=A0A1E4S5C4_CYBJN|nr:hypothetical protein CYBJADRAFT_60647 [Cyberlindnera jadinii NRRL Y-1542]ODV74708.1 hypothetical protein CYBJADRAFT_60647 [Cyberlindnera jadinii NRRL Y-1542]
MPTTHQALQAYIALWCSNWYILVFIVPMISATLRTRSGQPRYLTSCLLVNKYCTTFALLKASPNCWDIIPLQASPWSVDHLPRKDETP